MICNNILEAVGNTPLIRLSKLTGPEDAQVLVQNKETPLYVYCHSGARSRQAVQQLQYMGYQNAKNIGGITAYSGKVES